MSLGLALAASAACSRSSDLGTGADAGISDDGGAADVVVVDGGVQAPDTDGGSSEASDENTDSGTFVDGGCSNTPLTPDEQILVNLPADTWYPAHGTSFLGSGVCVPVGGAEGCGGIINDWSGGAYDPVHDKMLIWGGGHDGYWGNEIYSFDPTTFTWKRETTPSVVTATDQNKDPLDDGKPVSRHTYDHIQYIVHANRLWSRGGSQATNGGSTGVTWTFDLGSKTWTNMSPTATGAPYPTGFGTYCGASIYDPVTKKVFLQTVEGLQSYDYDTNTWVRIVQFGSPPLWPRYMTYGDKTGALDLKRGLFFSFGRGDYFVFDIAKNGIVTDTWITTGGGAFDNSSYVTNYPTEVIHTGGGDIIDADGPGVDYDPRADALVAWKGGAPYVLDLSSRTWTTKSAQGAPTATAANGTYGRWRYIAKYNVFILVNGPNDDVTFYKHTAGCGP